MRTFLITQLLRPAVVKLTFGPTPKSSGNKHIATIFKISFWCAKHYQIMANYLRFLGALGLVQNVARRSQ